MKQNTQLSSKFINFKIVHELKRRIRVVAPCIRKDQERSYILEILLSKREAIEAVRIVPGIAAIIIRFDPAQLPKANLFTLLDAVLGNIGTKSRDEIHEMEHRKVDLSVPEKDLNFAIGGMSCSSCALFLEMVLNRDPNISKASVNFATQTALVRTRLSKQELFSLIKSHSYETFSIDTILQRKLLIYRETNKITIAKKEFIMAGLLSLPVIIIGLTRPQSRPLRLLQALLTTPVVFRSGKPFFTKAIKLAKERTASMDTLIALGVGTAYA